MNANKEFQLSSTARVLIQIVLLVTLNKVKNAARNFATMDTI